MTEAQEALARRGQEDPASLTADEIRELAVIVLEQEGYSLPGEVQPISAN